MSEKTILSLKQISKAYPGVQALDHINLDFYEGEVHALCGENGAGKSTLIKIISGAIKPSEGEIVYLGKSYGKMTPGLSEELGIQVIYQELVLVPALSVSENMFLGTRKKKNGFVDFQTLRREAEETLTKIGAGFSPDTLVKDLKVANQQMVEIAKAVCKNAKFIIMDEPTAPLTDKEVTLLFEIIRELKKARVTVIYISHRLDEIFQVADRITVFRDGKKIATSSVHDVDKQMLIKQMTGRELKETFPERELRQNAEVVFEGRNISGNGVHDISFRLHKGEILGIAGLVGAGRTELAHVLFGAEPLEEGELLLEGEPVSLKSTKDAIGKGIGLVPEDRKSQGLLLDMGIDFNIVLPSLKNISSHMFVSRTSEKDIVNRYKNMLMIKTPNICRPAKNLSGGNQQKVVLAKWLATDPKVLIFDEPTRGIDVGAKQEIYKLMNNLAESGLAIIMISSEMEELLGMSDRIMVLCEGRKSGEIEKENFSQELILSYASGIEED